MSLVMSFQARGGENQSEGSIEGYGQKAEGSNALNSFKATGQRLPGTAAAHLPSEPAERSLQQTHHFNKRKQIPERAA